VNIYAKAFAGDVFEIIIPSFFFVITWTSITSLKPVYKFYSGPLAAAYFRACSVLNLFNIPLIVLYFVTLNFAALFIEKNSKICILERCSTICTGCNISYPKGFQGDFGKAYCCANHRGYDTQMYNVRKVKSENADSKNSTGS
jgi:hypothetical protein